MIPLTLQVKNFLSYGEDCPVLDFSAFRMACLSGRNGHGKSALLDAMTWAIWGEARKAGYSRTADGDLLRQSAEEMAVDFVFALNDKQYRVFRTFRRGGRSGKLEFYSREEPHDPWNVFTGSGKTDTQKKITETLGINYKTFVNSSFLQQGKADSFTRQSPKDRKEILGTILGLGLYDRLRDEAHAQWSACKERRAILEERLQSFDEELVHEDEYKKEAETLRLEFERVEAQLKTLLAREELVKSQRATLRQIEQQIERLLRDEADLQKRIEQDQHRLTRLDAEKTTCQTWIAKKETIHANKTKLETINHKLKQLLSIEQERERILVEQKKQQALIDAERTRLRESLAALRTEADGLNASMESARQLIDQREGIERAYKQWKHMSVEEARLRTVRTSFDEFTHSIEALNRTIQEVKNELHQQRAGLVGKSETLPRLKQEREAILAEVDGLAELTREVERLGHDKDRIEQEGKSLKVKEAMLEERLPTYEAQITEMQEKRTLIASGRDDECSLCRAPITPERRSQLVARYEDDEAGLRGTKKVDQQQLAKTKQDIEAMRKRFVDARDAHRKAEERLAQIKQKEQSLSRMDQEIKAQQKWLDQANEIERTLEQETYAADERKKRDALLDQQAALQYDSRHHDGVIEQCRTSAGAEHQWKRLQEEEQAQEKRTARLQEVATQIETLSTSLTAEAYLPEVRERIRALDEQRAPLDEQLKERAHLQDAQNELSNALSDWNQLHTAQARLPEITQEVEDVRRAVAEMEKRLLDAQNERETLEPRIAEVEAMDQQLNDLVEKRTPVEQQRNDVQRQYGAVQERLQRIEQTREKHKNTQQSLQETMRDLGQYQTLKKAFSRDGIPAMIVEQALPELEADANRLLHRLSNGVCSLALESQREKKSGGALETLDIKLSDEMGTRDYELFSGGEAFRADLALRIALSQLLCRRAGSQLQLLVIDEGFGTQDAEGLSRIVDAIDEIQDEFEKILVVTHLEELKERFFVRVEVTKDPGMGSRFEIIHTV